MKKVLLLLICLFVASHAHAAGTCTAGALAAAAAVPNTPVTLSGCYYVSSTGSDTTNNGLTEGAPFAHAPGMQNCASNCASAVIGANTGVIMRGGESWVHASFMWNIPAGTSGNPSYIGVDKTWFTGASWAKPIMDSGGTLISNNNGTMFTLGPNTVVDNFEVKNFFWDGTNIGAFGQMTMWNWGQQNGQEVSNMYIHGWTHPGTDHTATAGVACVFCTGGGGNSSADYNVIDGTDVANDHSINGFFDGPPKGSFNVIKQVSSAIIVSFDTSFHDNWIHDVGPAYCNTPFPAFAGTCTHENGFEDNADLGLTFYNNHMDGIHAGLAFWFAPFPSSTVTVWNNVLYGVDDNQVVDIAPPVYVPANCPQGATGNNYCLLAGNYIFYNNTIQCGNDSTQYDVCQNLIGAVGSGSQAQSVTAKNNHYITATTAAMSCTASGSGGPLSCTLSNNTVQTQATANGQNYNSSQTYAFSPTLGGSTIGAGADLTSSCTGGVTSLCSDTTYGCSDVSNVSTCPARTTIARPNGSPWNSGAYQYQAAASPADMTINGITFKGLTVSQ